MNFIPLYVYSEYSFLNSGLTLEKYFSYASKHEIKALGIADFGVMFSFPIFSETCKKLHIRPILGIDILLDNIHICLYIKNEEGYLNLIQISNALYDNKFEYQTLLKYQSGLKIVMPISIKNFEQVVPNIDKMLHNFEDFYLGLEIYETNEKETLLKILNNFSARVIIFPHIQYLKKQDAIVLDIVEAIKETKTLDYEEKEGCNYFPTDEEINKLYAGFTLYDLNNFISDLEFEIQKNRGNMIVFEQFGSSKEELLKHCLNGLNKLGLVNNIEYIERLNYELSIINQMGFNDYFLIVEDYVKFAKENNILVGPGRGSASGSLVSFCLGITTPDPLKHHLTFERFLNPSRKTMPDIDIDFEDVKREEIINYLRTKYGNERVANIITFQTIGAKQAIRDIGRVFNFDNFDINYLCKCLGSSSVTLKDAYRSNNTFKELLNKEPYYLKIIQLAAKIEGLIRQSSLHAAGVILNNENINKTLPTLRDSENHLITQYEMTYLEQQGFLKMDILALRNLTIIKNICEEIHINPSDIPINDTKALEVIRNNFTSGIFQLESNGMKKAIALIRPSSFDDITALIALFRPGPMDNIPLYANRKNSNQPTSYLNSAMEKILSSTYGIIVYQEQITQIATDIAGLSAIDADDFRRSITKKDITKMEALKEKFITGCLKNNYNLQTANTIYDTIEKFASYGFNKAHSVSYAYIVMQMAYLKAHYPLEFYANILENETSFTSEKMREYLKEIKTQNITLLVPNINISTNKFINYDNKLLLPLTAVKGLNIHLAQNIINEREKKLFTSLFDFVNRMYKFNINETIVSTLIDAGALDEFNNRETLRASISNAFNNAKFNATFDNSLFNDAGVLHFDYINKEDNTSNNLNREFLALGMMLSDSPLNHKQKQLQEQHALSIKQARLEKGKIKLGVMVNNITTIRTKKGEQMAFVSVNDFDDNLEIVVFPREYNKYSHLLEINNVYIVLGSFDQRKDCSFIADEIIKLED